MRINKIQNTNFSQQNDRKHQSVGSSAAADAQTPTSTKREVIALQSTEYKRVRTLTPRHSNPFLAQYIAQSNTRRTRGFIGRKPAWQAKKSYENTNGILNNSNNAYFDKSI